MPFQKEKIVQAYVEALNEVFDLVQQADVKAQAYKAKFDAVNPDLKGTNLSSVEVTALNSFITELNVLAKNINAKAIQTRKQPSHGTKALQ